MTWRQRWRPLIQQTLARFTPGARMRDKRRALHEAYPMSRSVRHWAYQVWLDEARVQLGLRTPRRRWREPKRIESLPGQKLMFE